MAIVKRKSCRAIILTPDKKVLLIKITNPYSQWSGWIMPGGGMEGNEDEITALTRELREELGQNLTIGQKVWERLHTFSWQGNDIEQQESFYLVHADHFNPTPDYAIEDAASHQAFRWWSIDEMKSSKENFVPKKLYDYLNKIFQHGAPKAPIQVGE